MEDGFDVWEISPIVEVGEAFGSYDAINLFMSFRQHLGVQDHGEDKCVDRGIGLSTVAGQPLNVANGHVLPERAHSLGPTCVDRAGSMLEVVQAMLAVIVGLGKFLQICQQERWGRMTLSLRMIG